MSTKDTAPKSGAPGTRNSGERKAKEAALRERRNLPRQHFGDGERDVVDEASWESFPASDPPGYSPGDAALADEEDRSEK